MTVASLNQGRAIPENDEIEDRAEMFHPGYPATERHANEIQEIGPSMGHGAVSKGSRDRFPVIGMSGRSAGPSAIFRE